MNTIPKNRTFTLVYTSKKLGEAKCCLSREYICFPTDDKYPIVVENDRITVTSISADSNVKRPRTFTFDRIRGIK